MIAPAFPRIIDPEETFKNLTSWLQKDILENRNCPGILVGLSGTDSLVTFMAAYRAFDEVGKGHRIRGVHFAPSEDFLDDHPEASEHLWFSEEVIPWVKAHAPKAEIIVDNSIDWRYEGLRSGSLADMAMVAGREKRVLLAPEEQYWVSGTRNRTEEKLFRYSNISMMVSLQPLIRLWKSEILQISDYLGVPKLAVEKSCQPDCICGRDQVAASHIRELDLLLMVDAGELNLAYVDENIPVQLKRRLVYYVEQQVAEGRFKKNIPYLPPEHINRVDAVVRSFETGALRMMGFNHRMHLYIAWVYLNSLPLEEAIKRYVVYLRQLLDDAGQGHRFSLEITESYFRKLDKVMRENPTHSFDELVKDL